MWIKKRPRKVEKKKKLSKDLKNESKGDLLGKVPYL